MHMSTQNLEGEHINKAKLRYECRERITGSYNLNLTKQDVWSYRIGTP